MSKNITIQEGGSAVQLTADKLKTDQVGGGTCLWIPEEDFDLTTKHISENGTYNASDDDKYGYSTVYVNVPGGVNGPASDIPGSIISGIDPEDGEKYTWETVEDPETGETIVVKTLMPSGIEITTLPSDLDYTDGETIDFSGIVVKLKKHDGTVYTDANYPDGVIPFSELTFPVTVARESGYGDWNADPSWVCSTANTYLGRSLNRNFYKKTDGPAVVAFSVQPGRGWKGPLLISDVPIYAATNYNTSVDSYVRDGKTWYFNHGFHYMTDDYDSAGLHVITDVGTEAMFDAMMEAADVQVTGGTGTEAIPVHWTPPADKFSSQKTRATYFRITVTAAEGGTTTEGGTTVDDEGFSGNEGNF